MEGVMGIGSKLEAATGGSEHLLDREWKAAKPISNGNEAWDQMGVDGATEGFLSTNPLSRPNRSVCDIGASTKMAKIK